MCAKDIDDNKKKGTGGDCGFSGLVGQNVDCSHKIIRHENQITIQWEQAKAFIAGQILSA